jgi:serine/threonine protein kinase
MNQDEIMTTSDNTFGRYTLLGRIAVGGMAEVFRGKFAGEKGFEKPVVIKKMLPQVASDDQMVQFFINEARVSALLQHENIVCIYDFGELEGSYYLAMEYLQGQDLNNIFKKATSVDNQPDLDNILWIASRVCDGLEYAHTLKDLTGRPLNIIHRDISPQNVFVTWEGNVKILDFGVAKTSLQSTETRVGMAKGKMAYMSPEQLEAKNIDHRSDIFAVGILMYEMVTQSRMYSGDTTVDVFKQVMHAEFEPIENRRPDLDPSLAAIINKALQKDPGNRFQSCREMQAAIDDCIFQLSLRPSNKTLSEYMVSLFPEFCPKTQPQGVSTEHGRAFNGSDETVIMDKTECLSGETVAVDFSGGTMAGDAGVEPPSSPDATSGPEVKPLSTLTRMKQRVAGSKLRAAVSITIALMTVIVLTGSYLFKQAHTSELALELLQKAENRLQVDQLTAPENDCAAFYYDEVKKLDPDSDAAAEGYGKIADRYADLAEDALGQDQYDRARSLMAKGFEFKPLNERLLNLKKQVTIEELLQQAENRFEAGRLTTPENDCAAFYYHEVAKLAPDSDAVQEGHEKLADRYADLAEDALGQVQYDNAKSLAAKGLLFEPDDERLLGLNKQIRLEELLQKAENCMIANQLTTPENNNAAFYYGEISKLDPDSGVAENGYGKIAGKYAELADDALKQAQYGNARSLTAKGLALNPDHDRLLGLNRQIKQELLQRAENRIEANQLTTPARDSAVFYYNEVERLYPDSNAVEIGYEKIATQYATLAAGALKQAQYHRAKSLTVKGLEIKPDHERLQHLDQQIKRELLQRAENCIKTNQLTTPENDCAVYYYSEFSKLYPDSNAPEKGHEKIAAKYAELAEDALDQYQFDSARYLTARGLEFKPGDERLLSLNKKLSTNKVGLFLKRVGRGIKNTID